MWHIAHLAEGKGGRAPFYFAGLLQQGKVCESCLRLFSLWMNAPASTAVDPNISMVAIMGISSGALLARFGGASKKCGFFPYTYHCGII